MIGSVINEAGVEQADLVIGLPSYNESKTIAYVTQQLSDGLIKYYPEYSAVIINADNNSPDDTRAAFLNTATSIPKIYISTPDNLKGKGYNFINIFKKAIELDAKVVVAIDSDVVSTQPEWVRLFIDLILKGNDFVIPTYKRHKNDGGITNNLCYPLVYGLLSTDLRQPIGGDFAFSSAYVNELMTMPWNDILNGYGCDIYFTITALTRGFRVASTQLLGEKIHNPSAPKLDLMVDEVVNSLFSVLIESEAVWRECKETDDITCQDTSDRQIKEKEFDIGFYDTRARALFAKTQHICKMVFSEQRCDELNKLFNSDALSLTKELWVYIVYDVIIAFKYHQQQRDDIVEMLRGLFFARLLSFLLCVEHYTDQQAEDEVIDQAQLFLKHRNYLIEKL